MSPPLLSDFRVVDSRVSPAQTTMAWAAINVISLSCYHNIKDLSADLSIKTSFVWNEKLVTVRALSIGLSQRIRSKEQNSFTLY